MKRLTIKMRVTLWYTLLMSLLVIFSLAILLWLGQLELSQQIRSSLMSAVEDGMEEIDYDPEAGLDIDEDYRAYSNGVYLILCDSQGFLLNGRIPSELKSVQSPAFRSGELQNVETADETWLCYDVYRPLDEERGLWLRGMTSEAASGRSFRVISRLVFVLFPLFVVVTALGGYLITRRAFRPVEQMRRTAEEISSGDDLSRRIGLEPGRDEIHQLALTYDSMLSRIEASFQREKQFTDDASHELRTPVSVISTQTEYLLRHEEMTPEIKARLETILQQSNQMSGLIAQLLMISRADRGQLRLESAEVDLSLLAESSLETVEEAARTKKIVVKGNIAPGCYVFGDEMLLIRCMLNLLDNAISYGKNGGTVELILENQEDRIVLQIKDDGIGIAPEHIEKIWDRFYRADQARTREGHSGLGLSMVKWIVEAHGGTVQVVSQLDVGSTFTCILPK